MIKNIVVIPTHKKKPDTNELIALKQAFKIFENQQIIFIFPESLDVSYYENFCKDYTYKSNQREFLFERFSDNYFKSIHGYNKLMLSTEIFERFIQFEYMLIYHFDTYVFHDHLDEWCNKGYDYIGCPWFKKFERSTLESPMLPFAGNGGFTLRKISACLALVESMQKKVSHSFFWATFNHAGYKLKLQQLKKGFRYATKSAMFLINDLEIYEDIAFARLGPVWNKKFNVAPPEVALKFGFERNAEVLYELNNKQLPFGCHAWYITSVDFWKKHINF